MHFAQLSDGLSFTCSLRNKDTEWRLICCMASRIRGEQLNFATGVEGAIQNSEAANLAALADAAQWCGPETILLVEDEAFVRMATAEVLESAGYRLVIATSAAEAFEACRRNPRPVDLLLADVILPGMSGRDLADQFESLCPRGRVLLMSGGAEQLAGCGQSRHGKKCLAKPFSIRVLLKRVREALDAIPFDLRSQA
jgi:CheY-like chemotaxis protein